MHFRNQAFTPILLLGFLLSHISTEGFAQTAVILKPKVDLRIELVSIAFRLAGHAEYNMNSFPFYVERIQNHFGKYKEHALIQFIRNDLKPLGIGYDAPMSMALSITEPPVMKPIVSFEVAVPEMRWNAASATTFVDLLNNFYTDTRAEVFFRENNSLYQLAAERFSLIFNELDLSWYKNFYGESPRENFRIAIGLGNGGANYGPQITDRNGNKTVYAIMGTWTVDSSSMPLYRAGDYFPTLIHEFNHSFIKHLIVAYADRLEKSAIALFTPLEQKMSRQAYGNWQIMIEESMVRAAVVKYLQDHHFSDAEVEKQITDEINRGFLWTSQLVDELNRYDFNRKQYPTLESFMPEICKFFEKTAGNIDQIESEINKKRPVILNIIPFQNGDQSVDPSIRQIEFVFDRPLAGNGYSIHLGDKGRDAFPEVSNIQYSEDKKRLIMEVVLKPDHFYQMVFMGTAFISTEGYELLPYEVTFKTR